MSINIYNQYDCDDDCDIRSEGMKKLDTIIELIKTLVKEVIIMTKELAILTERVTKATEIETSAILLLQGLSAQIAALKDDPIALQALADQLDASSNSLAEAIIANTPPPAPVVE